MIHLFEFLRYPFAIGLLGYVIYCLLQGKIWVGSRSYTGKVHEIQRAESPVRFYFWCLFFSSIAVMCLFVPFVET